MATHNGKTKNKGNKKYEKAQQEKLSAGDFFAGFGKIRDKSKMNHLDDQIADRRSFDRTCIDRKLSGIRRHLIQILILASASDDVDTMIGLARKRRQAFDRFFITAGKRYIDRLHDFTDSFRNRLGSFAAEIFDGIDHALRSQERIIIDINDRCKIFRSFGGFDQIREVRPAT